MWAGYNDFASRYPSLAVEWDYAKNEGMTPSMVTHKSNRKAWWKCRNGHSWQATVNHRASGHGCPYCSGRYAVSGYNDLGTLNRLLAAEWDYDKNGEALPKDFTPGSKKKVWWRCNKDHSWLSTIHNRTLGNGCPYCSGRNAITGYNDLLTA